MPIDPARKAALRGKKVGAANTTSKKRVAWKEEEERGRRGTKG